MLSWPSSQRIRYRGEGSPRSTSSITPERGRRSIDSDSATTRLPTLKTMLNPPLFVRVEDRPVSHLPQRPVPRIAPPERCLLGDPPVVRNARRVAGHETTKRSSAVRSRAVPSEGTPVQIERELYAASEQRLLERLRAVEDGVESVMLIGHNSGVEQLALSLAGRGQKLAGLRRKYPTGALATLEFSGRWGDLQPGRAELT